MQQRKIGVGFDRIAERMRNAIKSLVQRLKTELRRLCRINVSGCSIACRNGGQGYVLGVELHGFAFGFSIQKGRRPGYEVCLFWHWMGQAIYTKCKFLCPRAGLEPLIIDGCINNGLELELIQSTPSYDADGINSSS